MPELPEVETVRRDLSRLIVSLPIRAVKVVHPKPVRQAPAKFAAALRGRRITTIDRIGKLLILSLDTDEDFLLIHLKMTGQLIYRAGQKIVAGGHSLSEPIRALPNKHTRVIITFDNGAELFFNDLRLFGYLELVGSKQLATIRAGYGIEPLTKNFTLANFRTALHGRTTSVKALLLNQKIIAGLGNIYVDEACFRAKIDPTTAANRLTPIQITKLWRACEAIIALGVKHRGTTFNHFVDGNGERGGFLPFLKVYGRACEPCHICRTAIKKIKAAGRGTHFCPQCQA